MAGERWIKRWETNNTPWHDDVVNVHLTTFWSKILGSRDPASLRVFVPMCGKSLELFWLYEKGCTVVGVELATKAVVDFFPEHNLQFEMKDESSGDKKRGLYQSLDHRLQLYNCDIFDTEYFSKDKFDFILDRGSLVAILEEERQPYINLVHCLMKSDSQWLLMTVCYDITKHSAPPSCFSDDLMDKLLSDRFTTEQLAYGPFKILPERDERVTIHTLKK